MSRAQKMLVSLLRSDQHRPYIDHVVSTMAQTPLNEMVIIAHSDPYGTLIKKVNVENMCKQFKRDCHMKKVIERKFQLSLLH
jgi:hypothetical protein